MLAIDLLYQAGIAHCEQYQQQNIHLWHAQAHPYLHQLQQHAASMLCYQSFQPDIDALQQMGMETSWNIEDKHQACDLALLFPYKNKQQTLFYMAQAMRQLKPNGRIIIACANQYGAKSYQQALSSLAGTVSVSSKSKCRIFSAYKTKDYDDVLAQTWIQAGQIQQVEALGLFSQAGLFSWNRADLGSQLLLAQLPKLSGQGMDLCCGYGLLSVHLLQHSTDIACLHLIDAEHQALLCAKKNTQAWGKQCHYACLDASQDTLPTELDWLVCNPPFHIGQTREVTLGQKIIARGCQSLKRDGEIWMVANRQLPYEKVLEQHLRQYNTVEESQGFKIIHGVR